ncbi:MAG: hypothetical protein JWM85_3550 [Acidimicrobiaceae bacterium]|nr:hypothetical protein [Acidimicrobiaceae bacterium]
MLPNGQGVFIRPIEPSDAPALVEFHARILATSIHNRFFGAHPNLTSQEASSFATIDHRRRMAFVVLDDGTVVGVGRYEWIDNQTVAEVAFVVADHFQRQGLETILLRLLVDHARSNGFTQFVAQVLASNSCMREVFAHSGLSPLFRGHMGVIDVVLDLGTDERHSVGPSLATTRSGRNSTMNHDKRDAVSLSETPTLRGDLGRRVRYWRERAKMTPEELAEQSGMSAGYLEYLETAPTAQPPMNAVARIAVALGTSTAELLGGNVERSSGSAPAVRQPHLVVLEPDRNWTLLCKSGVGRIVFNAADGPVALPVNYAVSNHDIFLRTDEDTVIAKIDADERVSFEADHIDDAMSKGWSVVVQASCEHLGADCKIDDIFDVRVDPWAGGRRQHWIRLRARSIAGRAIEADL